MLRGSLVLLAGIVAVAGQARAGEGEGARVVCSNGTIQGEYTFTVHGKTLNPPDGKVTGLQDAIGIIKFDGLGKFIQEDYVLINGVQPLPKGSPAGFQHESGTYKVNPDCTGMMQVVIVPANLPAIRRSWFRKTDAKSTPLSRRLFRSVRISSSFTTTSRKVSREEQGSRRDGVIF
jgi:hypothetical protein